MFGYFLVMLNTNLYGQSSCNRDMFIPNVTSKSNMTNFIAKLGCKHHTLKSYCTVGKFPRT